MAITASQVKELREMTGAGMMDAKKALTETDGDMEAAIDWLRTKGLATAAKKSGRTAAEGLVAVVVKDGKGVAVEVNSETDFVAKNGDFQAMVGKFADAALNVADVEALKAAGTTLDRVPAIGGGSRSRYWLKSIATALGIPVDLPADGDFGAAFGAARLGLMHLCCS